jgi:hypothetical protein
MNSASWKTDNPRPIMAGSISITLESDLKKEYRIKSPNRAFGIKSTYRILLYKTICG